MPKKSLIDYGLMFMNFVAQNKAIDKLGLREQVDKITYGTVKKGFETVTAQATKSKQRKQAKANAEQEGDNQAVKVKKQFDLSLTDEQEMIVEMLKSFATDVIRPAAEEADHNEQTPQEILDQAQELGFTYFAIPEEFGGTATQRTPVTNMLLAQGLAYGDLGIALAILAPMGVANTITEFGTSEQKSTYLPKFLQEENPLKASTAVMEPSLMFDANKLETTAKKRGGGYVLNGVKTVVPAINNSELFLVAASDSKGTGLYLVESDAPGVSKELCHNMGLKPAQLGTLTLKNVKVSSEARIGGNNFSKKEYQTFTNLCRLAWCSMAAGTCRAVMDASIEYANERVAFGEPISHRQAVAFMIANMGIELEAIELMTQRAVARAEWGESFNRETYLAKLFTGDKAMQIGTDGVQVFGGHGFTKEYPVERWYRDLRAISMAEGGMQL